MILAVDAAVAEGNRFGRVTPEGGRIWRRRYFGPEPGPTGSASVDPASGGAPAFVEGEGREPQAFVVEQGPGAVVHPHFHHVDQFQVAIEGSGALGRHALTPLTVHFAGAHTGYGPIRPGPDGLKYLTARARSDTTGAQFLPAARARMQARPRRNRFAGPAVPSGSAALLARREVALESIMEEPDGMGAWLLRLPPGAVAALPEPAAGDGLALWVAAGAVDLAGAAHGRWTALFVPSEEPPPLAAAAAIGAELLILRFPRRADP
jgi:hypothetical protein